MRTVSQVASDLADLDQSQINTFNSKAKELNSAEGEPFGIVVDADSTLPTLPSSEDPEDLAQEVHDDHYDTEAHWFALSDEINGGGYEYVLYSHPRRRLD